VHELFENKVPPHKFKSYASTDVETYAAQGAGMMNILTERLWSTSGHVKWRPSSSTEVRGYSYGDVLLFVLLELACGDDLGYHAEDICQYYGTSIYPNNPENMPLTISVSG
jgi:hypothetical protein